MPTILIVEDHAMSRQMLKTLLGYFGHRVLEAADGSAALALALSENPDIIISDIVMPTMDGFEFVRRLRTETSMAETPVIFYTATYRVHEARRLSEALGNCRVLPKPSEPPVILQNINEMLGISFAETASPPISGAYYPALPTSESFQSAGLQLAAMIDFSFHLVGQRDPISLLNTFCRAANDILKCANAVLALRENNQTRYFSGSGKNKPAYSCPAKSLPAEEIEEQVVARRSTLRKHYRPEQGRSTESPLQEAHGDKPSSFESFLAIPFATPSRIYGWFSLGDKLDGSPFSDEDEEMAVALSAQAALAYENIILIEELKRRAAELERSNAELLDFASIAAHDLREPLRTVVSFGEILKTDFQDALGETGNDYLDRMVKSAARGQDLVKDLYRLACISTGDRSFMPTDLGDVVGEVTAEFDILLREVDGEVRVGELPTIEANSVQMQQLFRNLVSNGLKFRREAVPPIIDVVSTSTGDGWCEVKVSDNGIGFDSKYAERIFRPFQRLHGNSAYEGCGIGLSICRKIVELHGGAMTVESEPGKGSTFGVRLPVTQRGGRGGFEP